MQDMEAIDPIQNREPVFYEAYERQMEILANAFSREFFACEKALDIWEDSLDKSHEGAFFPLSRIEMLRQHMDGIADEWEATDNRLVRGGRRRMALLHEIRAFSEQEFRGDAELSKWREAAFLDLSAHYGSMEPDDALVNRGFFRDVLHHKAETLLKKCHRSRIEGIALLEFEREVRRLRDSIIGYDPQKKEQESSEAYIREVLDTLGKMEREAFHLEKDGEVGMGKRSHKKGSRLRKKSLLDGADPAKLKDKKRKEIKKAGFNKRGVIPENDSPVVIPPTILENGVQSEEDAVGASVAENIQTPSMKNPGEKPAKPKSESNQEVLSAFQERVEKEKQVFFDKIENAESFSILRGIGFVIGRRRKFFVENGEGTSPVVLEFVDKIKGSDKTSALEILDEANREIKRAWDKKVLSLEKEKEERLERDTFSTLVKVLGERRKPFKKDDKELVVESVSTDGIRIKYRNDDTKGQWKVGKIKSPQAVRFADDLEKNFGFELRGKKFLKKGKDMAQTPDNGNQTTKGQPDALTSTPVGDPGDQPPLPGVEPITPDAVSQREYADLLVMAEDGGDSDILSGSIKKGLSAMRKGAEKEGVDFLKYHTEHPGGIENALLEAMQKSFAHVGKNLKWSAIETDIFARTLIQNVVDKVLK
jgi:hypothetical protein